jgi:hypothetical protein
MFGEAIHGVGERDGGGFIAGYEEGMEYACDVGDDLRSI